MAELVKIERWRAFDGKMFDTQVEVEAYEETNALRMIEDASISQIESAIAYKPEARGLADAIESVATQIVANRKKLGFYKRRPNGSGEAEAETPPPHSNVSSAAPTEQAA